MLDLTQIPLGFGLGLFFAHSLLQLVSLCTNTDRIIAINPQMLHVGRPNGKTAFSVS